MRMKDTLLICISMIVCCRYKSTFINLSIQVSALIDKATENRNVCEMLYNFHSISHSCLDHWNVSENISDNSEISEQLNQQ